MSINKKTGQQIKVSKNHQKGPDNKHMSMHFRVSLASLALIHIVERHFAFLQRFGLGIARNIDVSAIQLNSSRPAVDFCPNSTVRGFQKRLFQVGSKKPSRLHESSCTDEKTCFTAPLCRP